MYTREAVLGMVAGRELDRAIALYVMGYEESRMQPKMVRMGSRATHAERYSTDIAAAWEVASKYPMFDIRRIEYFIGNITHEVTLYMNLEDGEAHFEASAKTAPEAICKCALLSLLKED